MAEFRRRQFLEFDKALHRSVPPQTVSAIQSGMRSIGTPGITALYTDEFTTDSTLHQAMLDQESIPLLKTPIVGQKPSSPTSFKWHVDCGSSEIV